MLSSFGLADGLAHAVECVAVMPFRFMTNRRRPDLAYGQVRVARDVIFAIFKRLMMKSNSDFSSNSYITITFLLCIYQREFDGSISSWRSDPAIHYEAGQHVRSAPVS
ncbi:hypothetical protein [Paraburkholderia sp. RL17-347-BIC-D]|uniref:hypothetical protein n=1 Tax=Paraburkholderia sp. RL17-347-BIC-D TaxID=3031632 RepID=UPI0038B751EA